MSIPTIAEEYAKLIDHLRHAQENCAMIAHLLGMQDSKEDKVLGNAWLTVEDLLKKVGHRVTQMAQGRLQ